MKFNRGETPYFGHILNYGEQGRERKVSLSLITEFREVENKLDFHLQNRRY